MHHLGSKLKGTGNCVKIPLGIVIAIQITGKGGKNGKYYRVHEAGN